MPIRINLLAEAVAEEELRRKDPVKRAAFIGAFFVALSLVWFSSTWLTSLMAKQNLNHVENEIQMLTNDYAAVQGNLKKIGDLQQRMQALDQLTRARFLQGNLLNTFQQTYVPNVQLIRLRVDQSYGLTGGGKSPSGVARPSVITEHITLLVDAKDFSPNAGDQINHFKDALLQQELIKQHVNPTNGIRLAAPPSALQPGMDGKPFVTFSYECRFLDKTP
ncbi:MAG TPA: hypothetical protein VF988_04740 [Verrucomicrobiae bacterium]